MPRKRTPADPRAHSRIVVEGVKQTPSRAMLRAVGYTDADFLKPAVGVASTWSNLTPCNMHIDVLAREAASGADAAGGRSTLFGSPRGGGDGCARLAEWPGSGGFHVCRRGCGTVAVL